MGLFAIEDPSSWRFKSAGQAIRRSGVVVALFAAAAAAESVVWDTGATHPLLDGSQPTYVGFPCGDYGSCPQRYNAMPFRIESPTGTRITRIDLNWFGNGLSIADEVRFIIWRRRGLSQPVDGDQFVTGSLGPYDAGMDDPRVPGPDDWLHVYNVELYLPCGDYYLTVYGDGGEPPNFVYWLTGGDLQAEDLEAPCFWRTCSFPLPGFWCVSFPQYLPGPDMTDPDDRWNNCFALWGEPVVCACPGDLNGDAAIDLADVPGFVNALVACGDLACTDLDDNGAADGDDLRMFVAILLAAESSGLPCPG